MITLCTGPMFSGKSTYILQKIERSIYGRLRVCLIKPKRDTRNYFAHSGEGLDNRLNKFIDDKKLDYIEISEFSKDTLKGLAKYDTILIDEFFMIQDCKKLIEWYIGQRKDINIYFAGLISSSENKLFKEAQDILPYMDDIVKLNGVCMECGSQLGGYSLFNGKKDTEIIIGDEDKYKCVCAKCYKKINGLL